MQNFRDRLTAASQAQRAETRWDRVLAEFCDWLNERYRDFLRASLSDSAAPRVRLLKIWPRGQRNVQSVLFSVYVTETNARMVGQEAPVFDTASDLESYLAEFVQTPAFRATLETLEETASQPVAGALRISEASPHAALLPDIAVEVPPDEQHKLADAAHKTPPPRIEGLHVHRTGGGRYEPKQRKPHWLVAGGYALEIESDEPEEDGRIRLSGTPVPASAPG
jgi:hypothetical protein